MYVYKYSKTINLVRYIGRCIRKYSNDRILYDTVIVGGGIVGVATARLLAIGHPCMKIAVVEKERELGMSVVSFKIELYTSFCSFSLPPSFCLSVCLSHSFSLNSRSSLSFSPPPPPLSHPQPTIKQGTTVVSYTPVYTTLQVHSRQNSASEELTSSTNTAMIEDCLTRDVERFVI